jgi:hypothetical protein
MGSANRFLKSEALVERQRKNFSLSSSGERKPERAGEITTPIRPRGNDLWK